MLEMTLNTNDTAVQASVRQQLPPLLPPNLHNRRKVFVLAYSTHDFVGTWAKQGANRAHALMHGMKRELQLFVSALSRCVTLLKGSPGVDPKRDIILLRLPIAQACKGKMYLNHCNDTSGEDPVNVHMSRLQRMLVATMQEEHPDVGLLDFMSWTWSSSRLDRAPCTETDWGGTHFVSDVARMASVQQMLHAASLLAVGRPGWEENQLGC